ncbi:2-oxoglutarate dehydrogenase E1 component [Pelomicrobium methylotrophicum]|uniref:2-oxoglutarate dehydrogenase E1 component n=1 Tax=Pelomicrobium methylotrophicum TaxID=2602750 RepID=A0A5C7EFS7_9PROT|nr:2-oxoglutarate dehydrogenase E1 component [Pelomicrobium methylotrophicum]TXF10767.1 2-oxoglutarate dehydrogenase E1 component [Pelomicrobium methylotrophicum]
MFREMLGNSYLFGANAPFIEALYEKYLEDPSTVPDEWRSYFDSLQRLPGAAERDVRHTPVIESFIELGKRRIMTGAAVTQERLAELERKQAKVLQLINAHRFLGLRHATLDPLNRQEKPYIPELDPAHYGFTEADMETVFDTGSLMGLDQAPLREILSAVRETYCRTIGFEYMYINDTSQKRWIQARVEPVRARPRYSPELKRHILERLTAAEGLEKYLHTRYVGQKRFSLEGGETLIPLLDHLLQQAGAKGVKETVIGMAHRGRLNVLVNTLGKMPKDLFAEFEGKHDPSVLSGDVKYHMGFSSDISTPGGPMHLTLAFNPSHLEIVGPVVEGSVRARQHRRKDKDGTLVLPVLIHGDAAFAGQGVVMETLNLSQTRGYGTGGTVHIVVNNQIGFTTSDPRDVRSTLYCTDVAKMVEAPIFHVNADDPEAALFVIQLALDFRFEFQKDVVVDLVCFRRHGHNEQDDPMVTQPLMYKKVNQHPGTRKLYADKLVSEGVLRPEEVDEMAKAYREALDKGFHTNKTILSNYKPPYTVNWAYFMNRKWTEPAETGVSLDRLKWLAERVTTVPPGFKLHPRVEKVIEDRRLMGQGKLPLDWGMAETLAYASLLDDGYGVRISGQDSGRGTFFHRHAVLHDQNRERWDAGTYVPLQHIKDGQPDFLVIDSPLSEEAVLGFEYGYATAEPNELVIWEAQFGDFANGAQVVIDQFIAAGEAKWGRICGLVMFLPHGYEGQGPEHSSARLERYLQLCAEYNMQVCIPSTPAQMFHLLRRQMIRPYRKPLIIFTPKSMLRHKESVSTLEELGPGTSFKPVNPETDPEIDPKKVRRVIFCSGKVYYDLVAARRERGIKDMAIVRLAQLYPFPHDDFRAEIKRYSKAKEILWCQEEPGNQGAWHRIQHYIERHMRPDQKLSYALRPSSASPAAGYLSLHVAQQKALIDAAFREKFDLD